MALSGSVLVSKWNGLIRNDNPMLSKNCSDNVVHDIMTEKLFKNSNLNCSYEAEPFAKKKLNTKPFMIYWTSKNKNFNILQLLTNMSTEKENRDGDDQHQFFNEFIIISERNTQKS